MIEEQAVGQSPPPGDAVLNGGNVQSRLSLELIRDNVLRAGMRFDLLHSFIEVLVRPASLLSYDINSRRFKHILANDVGVTAPGDLPHAWKDVILSILLQLSLQILFHPPILYGFHVVRHILHPIANGYDLTSCHESGFIIRFRNNVRRVAAVYQQRLLIFVFGTSRDGQIKGHVRFFLNGAPESPVLLVWIVLMVAVHHRVRHRFIGMKRLVFPKRIIRRLGCCSVLRTCCVRWSGRGAFIPGCACCHKHEQRHQYHYQRFSKSHRLSLPFKLSFIFI
ncbi:hypothetical protein D3C78_812620 [compost metagenome]